MGLARPAPPQSEITDIAPVITQTLDVLGTRIQALGVKIKEEFQPTLPSVYADPKQLEQVFLNLVVNALDAMGKGGVLSIRVGLEIDQKRLRIEISDTGEGIPPEQLSSIFDPFFSGKPEGEGTGLGLSICRSIIESHRGEITVSSTPGEGTTFSIFIPLASAEVGSILVVDDEEAVRTVLAEVLELEGYRVDLARNGAEGLAKLSEQPYGVTLLDLRMPGESGIDILKTIKTTSPQMPVIVVSGIAHGHELEAALRQGAFACVKKPWNMAELLRLIRTTISSSNQKITES